MGVRILYGDVAPEAKENFEPTSSQALYPSKLSDLQSNAVFPNYLNPCEKYSVMLDGTALLLPETVTTEKIGLISTSVTDSNGDFTTPVVLTLTADGLYSSQGFTFTFDTVNNIYPKSITIDWYDTNVSTETAKATETFNNVDNAFYFCQKTVQYFDKVVITFANLNMPYNRLRLKCIDYGYGTYLEAGELRNVKIIQQLNPISSQIEINTGDFVLDSLRDIPYNFQSKQPLTIYFNGNLQQVVFIKKATRNSERLWNIQAEDYISMLEGVNFLGGMYSDDYAWQIIDNIFNTAKVPYTIKSEDETDIKSVKVTGHIPICTCREALMQVLFAIGAVCDTSEESVPKVFKLANTISQTIPLDRIQQGQKIIDDETITGVSVTSHTFTANSSTDTTELYNASQSGISEVIDGAVQPIFVQFSNPCHTLNWNASYGSVTESGANYAIIEVTDTNFVLTGKEYEHTTAIKSKNNPLVLASDIQNIASVENATLISSNNVDNVLNICYDYYINKINMSLDIREGKTQKFTLFDEAQFDIDVFDFSLEDESAVNVGDKITAETAYLGNITGRIEKQTYSLIGNIIWKQCEVH